MKTINIIDFENLVDFIISIAPINMVLIVLFIMD